MATQRQPVRLKIVSIGDKGVGKSCLIKRYCEGKFVSRYITTIGVDYGVKPVKVNNTQVKVNFWDLSGDPEFLEVRNEFYGDAQGVLLIFDMSNTATFENLESWLKEMEKHGLPKDCPTVVLGNMKDKGNAVNVGEAKRWCASLGYQFFQTSASTGENVNTAFDTLFKDSLNYHLQSGAKRK
eukprot:gb/GECG01002027.1/.p1 GENE.gb/GECG01002027.1/~~gb/GECG01002027.1/.p1  ORF type:complete len:182 (+),score=27.95 gb/GECG01002027.1/:1-546(+)